jgi:predicted lipid-binding transport protein (Tim44 family)
LIYRLAIIILFLRLFLSKTKDKKTMRTLVISVLFLFISVGSVQAEMFIYPKEGQSKEKQEMDEFQCHKWAKEQSGSNPTAMSSQPAPVPTPQASNEGHVVGGGARGALLGAVGGAIGGDAGKGAKIGAGVGATRGLLKRRRNRIQQDTQQQVQNQVQQQSQAATGGYDKAYRVCLRGRGYEVE